MNKNLNDLKLKLKTYSDKGFVVTIFLKNGSKFFGTIKNYSGEDNLTLENKEKSFQANIMICEIHGFTGYDPCAKVNHLVNEPYIDLDPKGLLMKNNKLNELKNGTRKRD